MKEINYTPNQPKFIIIIIINIKSYFMVAEHYILTFVSDKIITFHQLYKGFALKLVLIRYLKKRRKVKRKTADQLSVNKFSKYEEYRSKKATTLIAISSKNENETCTEGIHNS